MGKGIAFNLGGKASSSNQFFKVESGSADQLVINSIIDEEYTNGYEPTGLTCGGSNLCFILFKKRGF